MCQFLFFSKWKLPLLSEETTRQMSNSNWVNLSHIMGFLWWFSSKESAWKKKIIICLKCRRPRFDPWVRKIPWRSTWQPTLVLLPRDSHGQRSLAGYSPLGFAESDTTEVSSSSKLHHISCAGLCSSVTLGGHTEMYQKMYTSTTCKGSPPTEISREWICILHICTVYLCVLQAYVPGVKPI